MNQPPAHPPHQNTTVQVRAENTATSASNTSTSTSTSTAPPTNFNQHSTAEALMAGGVPTSPFMLHNDPSLTSYLQPQNSRRNQATVLNGFHATGLNTSTSSPSQWWHSSAGRPLPGIKFPDGGFRSGDGTFLKDLPEYQFPVDEVDKFRRVQEQRYQIVVVRDAQGQQRCGNVIFIKKTQEEANNYDDTPALVEASIRAYAEALHFSPSFIKPLRIKINHASGVVQMFLEIPAPLTGPHLMRRQQAKTAAARTVIPGQLAYFTAYKHLSYFNPHSHRELPPPPHYTRRLAFAAAHRLLHVSRISRQTIASLGIFPSETTVRQYPIYDQPSEQRIQDILTLPSSLHGTLTQFSELMRHLYVSANATSRHIIFIFLRHQLKRSFGTMFMFLLSRACGPDWSKEDEETLQGDVRDSQAVELSKKLRLHCPLCLEVFTKHMAPDPESPPPPPDSNSRYAECIIFKDQPLHPMHFLCGEKHRSKGLNRNHPCTRQRVALSDYHLSPERDQMGQTFCVLFPFLIGEHATLPPAEFRRILQDPKRFDRLFIHMNNVLAENAPSSFTLPCVSTLSIETEPFSMLFFHSLLFRHEKLRVGSEKRTTTFKFGGYRHDLPSNLWAPPSFRVEDYVIHDSLGRTGRIATTYKAKVHGKLLGDCDTRQLKLHAKAGAYGIIGPSFRETPLLTEITMARKSFAAPRIYPSMFSTDLFLSPNSEAPHIDYTPITEILAFREYEKQMEDPEAQALLIQNMSTPAKRRQRRIQELARSRNQSGRRRNPPSPYQPPRRTHQSSVYDRLMARRTPARANPRRESSAALSISRRAPSTTPSNSRPPPPSSSSSNQPMFFTAAEMEARIAAAVQRSLQTLVSEQARQRALQERKTAMAVDLTGSSTSPLRSAANTVTSNRSAANGAIARSVPSGVSANAGAPNAGAVNAGAVNAGAANAGAATGNAAPAASGSVVPAATGNVGAASGTGAHPSTSNASPAASGNASGNGSAPHGTSSASNGTGSASGNANAGAANGTGNGSAASGNAGVIPTNPPADPQPQPSTGRAPGTPSDSDKSTSEEVELPPRTRRSRHKKKKRSRSRDRSRSRKRTKSKPPSSKRDRSRSRSRGARKSRESSRGRHRSSRDKSRDKSHRSKSRSDRKRDSPSHKRSPSRSHSPRGARKRSSSRSKSPRRTYRDSSSRTDQRSHRQRSRSRDRARSKAAPLRSIPPQGIMITKDNAQEVLALIQSAQGSNRVSSPPSQARQIIPRWTLYPPRFQERPVTARGRPKPNSLLDVTPLESATRAGYGNKKAAGACMYCQRFGHIEDECCHPGSKRCSIPRCTHPKIHVNATHALFTAFYKKRFPWGQAVSVHKTYLRTGSIQVGIPRPPAPPRGRNGNSRAKQSSSSPPSFAQRAPSHPSGAPLNSNAPRIGPFPPIPAHIPPHLHHQWYPNGTNFPPIHPGRHAMFPPPAMGQMQAPNPMHAPPLVKAPPKAPAKPVVPKPAQPVQQPAPSHGPPALRFDQLAVQALTNALTGNQRQGRNRRRTQRRSYENDELSDDYSNASRSRSRSAGRRDRRQRRPRHNSRPTHRRHSRSRSRERANATILSAFRSVLARKPNNRMSPILSFPSHISTSSPYSGNLTLSNFSDRAKTWPERKLVKLIKEKSHPAKK